MALRHRREVQRQHVAIVIIAAKVLDLGPRRSCTVARGRARRGRGGRLAAPHCSRRAQTPSVRRTRERLGGGGQEAEADAMNGDIGATVGDGRGGADGREADEVLKEKSPIALPRPGMVTTTAEWRRRVRRRCTESVAHRRDHARCAAEADLGPARRGVQSDVARNGPSRWTSRSRRPDDDDRAVAAPAVRPTSGCAY